jgi:phosphoserine phosphatase RsbU/P
MSPDSSRFFRARILVVDDAQLQVQIVAKILAKAGFLDVETASDGLDALTKTRCLEPALVILDLKMPNLDGFGYCELIRGDPSLPRMPILVQTASEERETMLRALSCGADDFLQKPLDAAELVLRVKIHLGRYFMLQDMGEMCLYLKMELEQTRHLLQTLEQSSAISPATLNRLNRHHEVLQAMTVMPSFATG